MNELLKLGVAFATGMVATYFLIGYVNEAQAPTSDEHALTTTPTTTASMEGSNTGPEEAKEKPQESTAPATDQGQAVPQQNYQPPAEPKYPVAEVVRFTGSQFSPDEVVIVSGGKVTWRNDSEDANMHIVTNFHPYHEKYPERSENGCSPTTFDQCASTGPGGSWTFTFNENGKWYYHTESDPGVTGMIRVMSREDYDKEF